MSPADVEPVLAVQRRSYARAGPGIRGSWPEPDALDGDGLARLFAEVVYGVLATARPDGRAHASPVAYSVRAGAFWVGSVDGLRLRNLRAKPWASLVVTEGQRGGGHRALTAEGPVHLHEGEALEAIQSRLEESWAERHGAPPTWAAALVELVPERVFSYGARRARG